MEHINIWANGVNEPMDPYIGAFTQQDFSAFDASSQYDFTSQYAHSSAPPSEVDFANSRGAQPKYYSTQTPKVSRRESARSIPQSQVQYSDSGYYSATTMSPTTVDMEFFPTFSHANVDVTQDYLMYELPSSPQAHCLAVSNSDSSMEEGGPGSPDASSDGETSGSSTESIIPPRSHPLYNSAPHADGLYHCPFLATEDCGHEPKMLKCEYDKYIDSHLKPFRCRHDKCSDLQFSSTACLLRHEREAHEMHGHEESLCEYPPCNRSLPGNGFRRSYNCKDHMTRVHGWIDHNPQDAKKRKPAGAGVVKATKTKSSAKAISKKQQIAHLHSEWAKRKAHLESMTHDLTPDAPLFAISFTEISNEMQTLKSIQTELSKLHTKGR